MRQRVILSASVTGFADQPIRVVGTEVAFGKRKRRKSGETFVHSGVQSEEDRRTSRESSRRDHRRRKSRERRLKGSQRHSRGTSKRDKRKDQRSESGKRTDRSRAGQGSRLFASVRGCEERRRRSREKRIERTSRRFDRREQTIARREHPSCQR